MTITTLWSRYLDNVTFASARSGTKSWRFRPSNTASWPCWTAPRHWRDGTMKKRWITAGMLEAQRSFRRIKGCTDMPTLVAAIARATNPDAVTPTNYAQVA
jgi:hypothetical protein